MQPQPAGDFAAVQRDAQTAGFEMDGFDQRPESSRVGVIGKVGYSYAELLRRSRLRCGQDIMYLRPNAQMVPQCRKYQGLKLRGGKPPAGRVTTRGDEAA